MFKMLANEILIFLPTFNFFLTAVTPRAANLAFRFVIFATCRSLVRRPLSLARILPKILKLAIHD